MRLKKSIYNIIFGIISQFIILGLGIILPRLFILNLGSEANGLIASIGQIYSYVGLIEAGIGATAVQALYKPITQNDKTSICSILSASNIYYKKIGKIYFFCVLILSAIYPFFVSVSFSYFEVVVIVFFLGVGGAINFYLQQNYTILLSAQGDNYVLTAVNLFINILISITKIILLVSGYSIIAIVISQFIITLLRIIFIYIYMKKKYPWLNLNVNPDFKSLSQRNYVLVHQLSYFVYSNTDILILTFFCDLKIVSVYTVYNMLIGVVEGVISTLTSSFLFLLGQLYNESKYQFKIIFEIFDGLYMLVVFILFTCLHILIIPFLRIYTQGVNDINYLDYKLAFLFILLKMVTTLRSQSQNAINFSGYFKETQKFSIVEACINLIISLILVFKIGIYGVLIGSIISTFYKGICVTNFINKKILEYTTIEIIIKYLRWIFYLIIFFIISYICLNLNIQCNNYFDILINAVLLFMIVFVIFFIIYILFNINKIKNYYIFFNKYIKRKNHKPL